MESHDHELAKRLYASPELLENQHIAEMGDALKTCFKDLSADRSLENIDKALARVRTADNALVRLRIVVCEKLQREK